jgi:Lanthionine synthetase C-like protein/Lantibiotic biosynthesis dehydratase C-term
MQSSPPRPSWCYGTPGLARAHQLVGLATGDTARQRVAQSAMLGCLRDPTQLAQIVDTGLCQGLAGVLQTAWRMAADAPTPELAAELPRLTASWARVTEHRSLPPDTPLDRLSTMESDLRQLMTVDASPASPLMKEKGSLTFVSDWVAAFAEAGIALGDLAGNGMLRSGVRAVLAHHIIFHWNRIGLPYTTQCILANSTKAVVLGQ